MITTKQQDRQPRDQVVVRDVEPVADIGHQVSIGRGSRALESRPPHCHDGRGSGRRQDLDRARAPGGRATRRGAGSGPHRPGVKSSSTAVPLGASRPQRRVDVVLRVVRVDEEEVERRLARQHVAPVAGEDRTSSSSAKQPRRGRGERLVGLGGVERDAGRQRRGDPGSRRRRPPSRSPPPARCRAHRRARGAARRPRRCTTS